jgi:hypothetical protein
MKFLLFYIFNILVAVSYGIDIEAAKPTTPPVTVTVTASPTTCKATSKTTSSATKTTLTTKTTSSMTKPSSCAPTAPAGTQSLYGQC